MTKNKLKAMAVVMMLSVTSMFIAPKKSEAGIILITSGGAAGAVVAGYILGGIGLLPVVFTPFSYGISLILYSPVDAPEYAIPLLASLVLGADGSLPSDKLVSEFSKKYAFIENKEVIEQLVSEIKEKFGKLNPNEKKYVSFTSSEIDSVLSSIDTSGMEQEILKMKKDLE